jgi:glycosyltransferase involved in cell wall biosynthesis
VKVLIVNSLYYPNFFGGVEVATQRLSEALVAQGHEVSVATLSPEGRLHFAVHNGVRIHYLPVTNFYVPGIPKDQRWTATKLLCHALDSYNPLMANSLGRVLDTERPDIVNTHSIGGFSTLAWEAVNRRGLPLAHSLHGVDLLCPLFMLRRGKVCSELCGPCRVYSWPRMRMSRSVRVLTAPSRFLIGEFTRNGGFPNAQSAVIYNFCQSSSDPLDSSPETSRELRIGYLGRLHASKGIGLLIRSFLNLPPGKATLVIAGKGTPNYERELRQMTEGRSDINWLGFVKPGVLLRQVDILVVPSLCQDNAPLSILEALAHGVPLIGSLRGGIPELMGEGTGWFFEPSEPGALTRTILDAIKSRDTLPALSACAKMRALKFTAEEWMKGYLAAYTRAIEKSGASVR